MDVKLSSLISILNRNTYVDIQFDNESMIIQASAINYLNLDLLSCKIKSINLIPDGKTGEVLFSVIIDY